MPGVIPGQTGGGFAAGVNNGKWFGATGATTGGVAEKFSPDDMLRGQTLQWLKNQYGKAGGRNPVSPWPDQPGIGTNPIWSQQQINQNVNAMRGKNAATTGTQMNNMSQNLASRGYGGGSPLEAALRQMAQGQQMATNTEGERGIRWDAAQGNAGHVLNAEKARSDAWAQHVNALVNRDQVAAGRGNALFAAIASML